jgi:hypothetical protein
MDSHIDLSKTRLGDQQSAATVSFCEALLSQPDVRVESITLYGSAARQDYRAGKSDINLLILLDRIDVPILKGMTDPIALGKRHGIAPFFLTDQDLRWATRAFPAKFLSIKEHCQVLFGKDPLQELSISREYLRLRCGQEITNLLLSLRRYYILGGGHNLSQMMVKSTGLLLENMRIVVYLSEQNLPSRAETIDAFSRAFGMDPGVLRSVSRLRDEGTVVERDEAEQLYGKFMAAVEKVAEIANREDRAGAVRS